MCGVHVKYVVGCVSVYELYMRYVAVYNTGKGCVNCAVRERVMCVMYVRCVVRVGWYNYL